MEEGLKNVLQKNTGGTIEKIVYDDDKKWLGWNDDAVVDPVRDAEAFVGGALPSILSSGAKSVQQANTDTQAGKMIKAADKTTNLLQDALEAPRESAAYNMAKEMSERLEVALIETGMDAGDLYHMSGEDQKNLIISIVDRTLTDREIGELSRMLSTSR